MKNLLYTTLLLGFSSCATIMNGRFTDIDVYSKNDETAVVLNDSVKIKTPLVISVPRSYNNLDLTVSKDSVKKVIKLKSKVSNEFKWGNLIFSYYAPIAYIIDASSRQKIYDYSKKVLIDFETGKVINYTPSQKKQVNFVGSIPYFNYHDYRIDDDRFSKEWFKGLSLSIEYFHSPKSYMSFTLGSFGLDDDLSPILGESFDPDTVKLSTPISFIIQNNNVIRNFSFGYGFNITRYNYHLFYDDIMTKTTIRKKTYWAFGLSLSCEMKIIKDFYVGLRHSPTLYNLEESTFDYSSITSLEFKYKLKISDKSQALKRYSL